MGKFIKTQQVVISLIFILTSKLVLGQLMGFERINDSDVSPWIPKFTIEYQYVYHFGDSEAESDLILLFSNDKIYGQIKYGAWSDDGNSWVWTYENLTNVKVEGNKFYSDQTDGEFVIYDSGVEKINGLKIYDPWIEIGVNSAYEVGVKSYSIENYYNGLFTKASKRLLSKEELRTMTKSELKFMRNEIFARYGYIFNPGGEMDTYFNSQNWYSGQHYNVDNFLTDLERENIELIQLVEKE
ncbi:YARHG domain-containing protein [Leptobacterium sp. I13]|uniref:YARHG domain-containing protein n=1 Tax=Leptobacterium meishanense TaxID=3128904 RepID=UPI0030ED41C1